MSKIPTSVKTESFRSKYQFWIVPAVLLVLTFWAYWTTLAEIASKWSRDPQYSHGYLVPVFAAGYLWMRRRDAAIVSFAPTWWGIPLIFGAIVMRLAGAYLFYGWFDQVSILPLLAGLVLTIGGWPALRWSWVAIAFLAFMLPMPYRVEHALAQPLQRIATVVSTYALQTMGIAALPEGNVIVVDDARLNVAEACSGLRMLLVFFALCFAMAIIIERPWWQKVVVIFSAGPIALVSNVVRIVATGTAHAFGFSKLADFIHDHAEWLMMPVALALVGLLLSALSQLFVTVDEDRAMSFGLASGSSKSHNAPPPAVPLPIQTSGKL